MAPTASRRQRGAFIVSLCRGQLGKDFGKILHIIINKPGKSQAFLLLCFIATSPYNMSALSGGGICTFCSSNNFTNFLCFTALTENDLASLPHEGIRAAAGRQIPGFFIKENFLFYITTRCNRAVAGNLEP
jgi:hypothetical protein